MEVAQISASGECTVVRLSSKEWKQCELHFETDLLEIRSRQTSVRNLYHDASKVHPFPFCSAFNRYLIPHDAVIRAKHDEDVRAAVKRSLVDLGEKGKLLPSDAGYVTKDVVDGGDVEPTGDDDAVEEDVEEHEVDDDQDSTMGEEDEEGDDQIEEGEPIVDDDWYGGSVGTA